MTIKSNEFNRIERFFKPLTKKMLGAFSLQDDAAELHFSAENNIVVTTDTIVETIHFMGDEPASSIARKLLSVNISDLAAKGAVPFAYSLSLGLPDSIDDVWIEDFVSGLAMMQAQHDIHLIGGDSVTVPDKIILTVTAMGKVPLKGMVRRSTVLVGDSIYVTGSIGDGALGLLAAKEKISSPYLLDRYRHPQARSDYIDLIQSFATASMDVSDGLLGDCEKLMKASNVSGILNIQDIPFSLDVQKNIDFDVSMRELALTGGDDYELIFTVRPDKHMDLMKYSKANLLSISRIGEVTQKSDMAMTLMDEKGDVILFDKLSFSHT